MKIRVFTVLIIFFATFLPVRGETSGYLSFEYVKGQRQTDVLQGSFQNAQLGLVFSGELTSTINHVSEIRFKRENRVEIEQALVGFRSSNFLVFKLGLYLVPFGKYNRSNRPHQAMLIRDPLHIEKMFPSSWRDMGILIEGRLRSLFYSAYLGNGLSESEYLSGTQQFKDNNEDKGKGGRVGLTLSQGFEVAFSYYRGKYDEENKRNLILQAVDLTWVSEGFLVQSEYSKAHLENPEDFLDGKAEGFFVLVSFDIENIRPVVSYQRIKYNDPFHGQGFIRPYYHGKGISEEKSRWTLGFFYFASQNVFLKFEYDFNREKGLELKDNSYSVQVALSF